MNWFGNLLTKLGGIEQTVAPLSMNMQNRESYRDFKETLDPRWEYDPSDKPKERFRELTQMINIRDLTPLEQDKMIRMVYYLYETNAMAKRLINLTRDFAIGPGIAYSFKPEFKEKLQPLIDEFWYDPINMLHKRQFQYFAEVGLYGELCLLVSSDVRSGAVRLGYLDPHDILKVWADPDNPAMAIGIERKLKYTTLGSRMADDVVPLVGSQEYSGGKRYAILQVGDGSLLGKAGQERFKKFIPKEDGGDGDGWCFYWSINHVSNSLRGRSDLLPLMDWVDAYEQFLFNRLDMQSLIRNMFWDVTIEGMNPKQAQEWAKNHPAPQPGSVEVHTPNIQWEANAPNLQAQDASSDSRILKNFIIGMAGFPEHWFGEAGSVNRATALTMDAPTLKFLENRQAYYRQIIKDLFDYKLQIAAEAGVFPKDWTKDKEAYDIIMPELGGRPMRDEANALAQLSLALSTAVSQGWLPQQKAADVFAQYVVSLGYRLELANVAQEIAGEMQDQAVQDLSGAPPGAGNGKKPKLWGVPG